MTNENQPRRRAEDKKQEKIEEGKERWAEKRHKKAHPLETKLRRWGRVFLVGIALAVPVLAWPTIQKMPSFIDCEIKDAKRLGAMLTQKRNHDVYCFSLVPGGNSVSEKQTRRKINKLVYGENICDFNNGRLFEPGLNDRYPAFPLGQTFFVLEAAQVDCRNKNVWDDRVCGFGRNTSPKKDSYTNPFGNALAGIFYDPLTGFRGPGIIGDVDSLPYGVYCAGIGEQNK